MLAGFGFGALGFAAFALAPTGRLFLIGIPFSALFGLTYPNLQSIMTGRVGENEQGRLQGAVASLMGVAGIIAPVMFTQTFAAAIEPSRGWNLPGLPFLLASALLLVAAGIASRERA